MQCPANIFRSLVAELLERGETSTFRVHGTSMHPTIKDGEVVRVASADTNTIRRGDIIAFDRAGILCVHRVARVDRDARGKVTHLLTTGDGLWMADGLCVAGDVLGVVVEVVTPQGSWQPGTGLRRTHGRFRSFLTLHPRARAPLSAARRGLARAAGPLRVHGTAQSGGRS